MRLPSSLTNHATLYICGCCHLDVFLRLFSHETICLVTVFWFSLTSDSIGSVSEGGLSFYGLASFLRPVNVKPTKFGFQDAEQHFKSWVAKKLRGNLSLIDFIWRNICFSSKMGYRSKGAAAARSRAAIWICVQPSLLASPKLQSMMHFLTGLSHPWLKDGKI